MTFDIRLGAEIYAVEVAEIVPKMMVGIMGGTHSVDVVTLHEPDVGDHIPKRYRPPGFGAGLMAVHAFELDLPPVDENGIADDLLLLEADAAHTDVVTLLQNERVEVGIFRGPEMHIGDRDRLRVRQHGDGFSLRIVQRRRADAADALDRKRGRCITG